MSTDDDNTPIDKTIEIVAPFDDQQTPRSGRVGVCWRCKMIVPVTIIAPPPGSHHEAMHILDVHREALQIPTCVASRGGGWALCAVRFILRLGGFELYFGPERRVATKLPPLERRALPPPIPTGAQGGRE